MLISVEEFKSNVFTVFLAIGLLFGVLLYDYIQLSTGFSYIDEFLALFLCLFTLFIGIRTKQGLYEKYWLCLFLIFGFYLVYSLYIKSNVKIAIIQDAIVQIKPYLGFFCSYTLAPELTRKQKRFLKNVSLFTFFCLILISFDMGTIMGHVSRFATATVATAMTYLLAVDLSKKTIFIFILILTLGLLSGRSKAYGYFVFVISYVLIRYNKISLRFSLKSIIIASLVLIGIIYFSWEKIYYYFIFGAEDTFSGEVEYAFARPALYIASWQVLFDNFLFGSGFGSFATYFSGEYYSEIYYKYGLNIVHGLTEDDPMFIADSYYPSLVQYGMIGISLVFLFWFHILKNCKKWENPENIKYSILTYCIVVFFIIEGIADSTFIHNRGLFIMIILGLAYSELSKKTPISNERE